MKYCCKYLQYLASNFFYLWEYTDRTNIHILSCTFTCNISIFFCNQEIFNFLSTEILTQSKSMFGCNLKFRTFNEFWLVEMFKALFNNICLFFIWMSVCRYSWQLCRYISDGCIGWRVVSRVVTRQPLHWLQTAPLRKPWRPFVAGNWLNAQPKQ